MDIDLKLDRKNKTPLYLQISNQIIHEINSGSLKAGTRLPAERKLATRLDVNRSTVVNAYSELEAGGYIFSHVGKGTMVADQYGGEQVESFCWQELLSGQGESLINPYNSAMSDLLRQRDLISMDSGIAAPELYPKEEIAGICREVLLSEGEAVLKHNCAQGLKSLRESLSSVMKLRDVQVFPENIVVLNGSQQGLDLIARLFIEPGDCVVLEHASYIGAIDIFRAYGAKLVVIPADGQGMVVDRLEVILNRVRPKLIYTIPTFQNPKGVCMTPSRRKHLVELAAKYHVPVLEDDAYGMLHFNHPPAPPLASMDQAGTVIYLSTMSKILCPGLRLGWMAAPPDLVKLVSAAKQLVDLHNNNLIQRMVDLFIRRGLLEEHLAAVRESYLLRRNAMLHALEQYAPEGMSWNKPEGGFYIWATLPEDLSATRLLQEAVERKVSFVAGPAFYSSGGGQNKIRLNFTQSSPELIHQGIRVLCKTIKDLKTRSRGIRAALEEDSIPIV